MVVGEGGRDWRAYDVFRRDEEALFLCRAREAVWGMPPPWERKRWGGLPTRLGPWPYAAC